MWCTTCCVPAAVSVLLRGRLNEAGAIPRTLFVTLECFMYSSQFSKRCSRMLQQYRPINERINERIFCVLYLMVDSQGLVAGVA